MGNWIEKRHLTSRLWTVLARLIELEASPCLLCSQLGDKAVLEKQSIHAVAISGTCKYLRPSIAHVKVPWQANDMQDGMNSKDKSRKEKDASSPAQPSPTQPTKTGKFSHSIYVHA